jgi:hypothetical protein
MRSEDFSASKLGEPIQATEVFAFRVHVPEVEPDDGATFHWLLRVAVRLAVWDAVKEWMVRLDPFAPRAT